MAATDRPSSALARPPPALHSFPEYLRGSPNCDGASATSNVASSPSSFFNSPATGTDHPAERQYPRQQSDPEEAPGDPVEKVQIEGPGHAVRGDSVHPEGEDQGPVVGVIAKRHAPDEMTPDPDDDEEWYPPARTRPREHGHAAEKRAERHELGHELHASVDFCAGQGGDREGSHVDPVGRRSLPHRHAPEPPPITDERDDHDVDEQPGHAHRKGGKQQLGGPTR